MRGSVVHELFKEALAFFVRVFAEAAYGDRGAYVPAFQDVRAVLSAFIGCTFVIALATSLTISAGAGIFLIGAVI